jgi:hypothetical protein
MDFGGALSALIDPKRSQDTEDKAFWAGMTAPASSAGVSTGNAMAAQVSARENQDKLRAAYIPLIMQSMVQQRSNDLGYAKMMQETLNGVNPKVDSALSALQAGSVGPDGQPVPVTAAQAHSTVNNVARMYGLPGSIFGGHHNEIDQSTGPDGTVSPDFLAQLRLRGAPAEAGIGKFGKSAAGQSVIENAGTGTVTAPVAVGGSGGPGDPGINPTANAVAAGKEGQGDIKGYGAGLGDTVGTYNQMMQRVNAVGAQMKEFTPGKYAGVTNGFAAALKDLSTRFPNASSETLQGFAKALSSSDGTADGVSAQQFAESLQGQESLAQVKSMLTNPDGTSNGRVNQAEFKVINNLALGALKDPGAFKKFQDFTGGNYKNALAKYSAWGDYLKQTDPAKYSVHAFDVPWEVEQAKKLSAGQFGDITSPPGAAPAQPPSAVVAAPAPRAVAAPVAQQQQQQQQFDPQMWEQGAVQARPGSKPVVKDPTALGGYRYAAPAEGAKRAGPREVSGRVQ